MAQAQAAAAPLPEGDPAPRKSRKLLYTMIMLTLLAGAGGGWFFLSEKPAGETAPKPVVEAPPVFYPLETFTVNLVPEYGDQYLQVEMTLKALDQKAVDAIKARMPEVRNRVLLLLSSMRASQLTPVTGKQLLAAAVRDEINTLLDPQAKTPQKLQRVDNPIESPAAGAAAAAPKPAPAQPGGPVREVLFTSFIIQ